jgi:integrase
MATITSADVRAFTKRRLDAKVSAAEINRELAILKRMFTLAIHGNKLMVRPHIPMLQEHNVRTGFFEREDFDKVRANLPAALQPVATFAYLTGWRIQSEILKLQWRQVDLEVGTVRLDPGTTKNRDGRLSPFGQALPELRQLLEEQKAATKAIEAAKNLICQWVFHRNGRPIKSLRKAWENACVAAGVPGRIPHDLRRTAVRNLERAGVSRGVAMQLTGHKTESVYRRYAIVSERDLGAGIEKLGQFAAGTIPGTKSRSGKVRRFKKA